MTGGPNTFSGHTRRMVDRKIIVSFHCFGISTVFRLIYSIHISWGPMVVPKPPALSTPHMERPYLTDPQTSGFSIHGTSKQDRVC